jgi:hypothetical protein
MTSWSVTKLLVPTWATIFTCGTLFLISAGATRSGFGGASGFDPLVAGTLREARATGPGLIGKPGTGGAVSTAVVLLGKPWTGLVGSAVVTGRVAWSGERGPAGESGAIP